MKKLNCFGDNCPIPLLKAQDAVKDLTAGDHVMLVTDHNCVVSNLEEYFTKRNFDVDYIEAINGVWEITITKHR